MRPTGTEDQPMTGVIDLAWIGTILRTIQAEQRFIRGKSQLILSALNEAITLLMQRIGNFAGVHGYPDPIEPALLSGGATP
jgi:hypothetical protein